MATLIRSKDRNIWFKHINDPTDELLTRLQQLEAGQLIVLRLGKSTGVWVRFSSDSNGKIPDALRCGDNNSKQIWNDIPIDGRPVEIALVEILTTASALPTSRNPKSKTPIELEKISAKLEGAVLCVGVDVAWWGGQKGSAKRDTRTETIAYVTRNHNKWSQLALKRIDLNNSYNPKAGPHTPNADADASLLAFGIKEVLDAHPQIANVILAVDMPIMARYEGATPPKKANDRGEKGPVPRQCDLAWMELRNKSPKEWRRVNIFPGAPIVPRVRAIVERLRELNFEVYGRCANEQKRVIVECFPNEVAWSTGILGFAEGLTIESLQLYKRLGKNRTPLPHDLFDGVWRYPLSLAFRTTEVDCSYQARWLNDVEQWLKLEGGVFDEASQIGKTGKLFDDVIDSVLSLSAAIGFATGNAHIHQGTDPEDGHIIGPGVSRGAMLSSEA